MKNVVVLADAAEDIEAARDFYDAVETGVGGYWRAVFPLAFTTAKHSAETQVFAILDLRRNPNWIRKELQKRDVE